MTPTLPPSGPHPSSTIDIEAIARRVLARDRGEPLDGPYSLRPEIFDADRDRCLDAQRLLERLLRARSAFHREEAAGGPSGGSRAPLSAALDRLAKEVATMLPTMPSITLLAEAERLTGPLAASAAVTAVLDASDSCTSAVVFLKALVAAMERGTVMGQVPATITSSQGTSTDEPGADA